MADFNASPMDWMNGWAQVNQQTWDSWSKIVNNTMAGFQQAANPQPPNMFDTGPMRLWRENMNWWWQQTGVKAAPPEQAMFRNMLSMGENYFHIAEEMFKAFYQVQSIAPGGQPVNWQTPLQQAMENMKKFFTPTPDNEAFKGLMAFWGLPLDTWRGLFPAMSLMPGDWMQHLKEHSQMPAREFMETHLNRFFSVPALGFTREYQGEMNDFSSALVGLQNAYQGYLTSLSQVPLRTMDLLYDRLLRLGQGEQTISTMKGFFDLWVDCGEVAYAEVVNGEEYAEANARLVNALFSVKQRNQLLTDHYFSGMGVPIRDDIDNAFSKITELKRKIHVLEHEVRTLRKTARASKELDLAKEMVAMRIELQEVKTRLAANEAAATSSKSPKGVDAAPHKVEPVVKAEAVVVPVVVEHEEEEPAVTAAPAKSKKAAPSRAAAATPPPTRK